MKPWITSLTMLGFLLFPSEGSEAECSIESVEEGETTNLTCTFGENIKNKTLKIYHKRTSSMEKWESVLFCPPVNHTNESCTARPTYSLHSVDSYTIIILIQSVTESHVGIYKCEALPTGDNSSPLPCNFSLVSSLKSSRQYENSTAFQVFQKSSRQYENCTAFQENCPECEDHRTIYIVFYCFIALSALITITVVGYFVIRYLKGKKMLRCPKLSGCLASTESEGSQRPRESPEINNANEDRDSDSFSSSVGAGSTSTQPECNTLIPFSEVPMTEMSSNQNSGQQRSNTEETAFIQNTQTSTEQDAE